MGFSLFINPLHLGGSLILLDGSPLQSRFNWFRVVVGSLFPSLSSPPWHGGHCASVFLLVVPASKRGWDPIGGAPLGRGSEGSLCTVVASNFRVLRAAVRSPFGAIGLGGFVPFWCQFWWMMMATGVWLGRPPNLGQFGVLPLT